jgi:hypothetical protein
VVVGSLVVGSFQPPATDPYLEGSTGQPKPHPGFAVARGFDETALALYREITRTVDEILPELAKQLR